MRLWQLIALALAVLVGGFALIVVYAPLGCPTPHLVMEARFPAGGRQRRLMAADNLAVVVRPGGWVQVVAHPKSEPTSEWRKVAQTAQWISDWADGPKGPGGQRVSFRAPTEPGTYEVRHVLAVGYEGTSGWARWSGVTVHAGRSVFVLVPRPTPKPWQGWIGEYEIGDYPAGTQPPPEFVKVTLGAASARLSEHYRLDEFASPGSTYPRFTVVSYALLDKLEALTGALQEQGYLRDALAVYSVYRTPLHNAEVGGATRSHHLWGRAADFIVDERFPAGEMDDLNGDGRTDIRDAMVVGGVVRELERWGVVVKGGTGVYQEARPNGDLNASVHVDVRGTPAKWARDYRTPGDREHWQNVRWEE
jgi:hypothetical protein